MLIRADKNPLQTMDNSSNDPASVLLSFLCISDFSGWLVFGSFRGVLSREGCTYLLFSMPWYFGDGCNGVSCAHAVSVLWNPKACVWYRVLLREAFISVAYKGRQWDCRLCLCKLKWESWTQWDFAPSHVRNSPKQCRIQLGAPYSCAER